MSMLLTILVFFPLVGVIAILLADRKNEKSDEMIKWIALATSVITLVISVVVLANYNSAISGLQMVDRFDWIPAWGIQYYMGVDGISILMLLLTDLHQPPGHSLFFFGDYQPD
jgi:NADH-quinone oxidoreductase subunit M